ncbi:MAG: ribonuclease R [Gammaproteobacteria bacterium]
MKRRIRKKQTSVEPHLVPERKTILDFLAAANKPRSLERIAEALHVKSAEAREALERRLQAMQRDGQIIRNRREGYGLVQKMDLLRGTVIGHPDGFGFLRLDAGGDDLYLSAGEMRRLMHGDVILAHVRGVDRRGRREGAVVEVLERANRQVVGRYHREVNLGYVVPDNRRLHQDILIPPANAGKAKSGNYVVAEIIQHPDKHTRPVGRITEILGKHMAPDVALKIAIRSYELPCEWPDKVENESRKFSREVREADTRRRVDLRALPLVTIDGEDARDFDDAVYCEKTSHGWRLIVAIADVSHYVRTGSAIDMEARERGNSVYFPRQVIPMLPEVLSNELCSLNPHVDRLCLACELTIGHHGDITDHRFYEGVMRSAARMTYTNVAAIVVGQDAGLRERYKKIAMPLDNLYALYLVMHRHRRSLAVIDFASVETRFDFDDRGNLRRIYPLERNDAHRLIEEFMLAANVAAAQFLLGHKIPALFRIHDTPKQEKLDDLHEFLKELGLSLAGGDKPSTREYALLLERIRKRDDRHLIETVLLRSMPLAVYGAENTGHFGLGFPAYTHFTSPIRRYPDLLVHRALRHLLQKKTAADFAYSAGQMQEFGAHCSMTERRADEATREVVQWYKCQFMREKVGDIFPGTISSVTSFGVFVELDEIFVEGLIHITSLPIDYYHFDPVHHRLRGERTGRIFRLANRVRVKVIRVDVDDKKIDFELVDS